MSGVELQEHQGNAMEQTTVPDEVRLDNKLKELGALEKEIFSGDGIVDGQSSDTAIDESYKEGLQQAKTIQQKIDFIESLVLEFQYERKLQELFQKQEKSPYISQEGSKDLQESKDKIQHLFQKYPQFKEGIIHFITDKFDASDYFVQFYEKTPISAEIDRKSVSEQVFNNTLNNINISALPDLEKTIQYIDSNSSVEDKNAFLNALLMWAPESIPNLGEKMDAISQLSFYKKEGVQKYFTFAMSSASDTYLINLLKCDTQKLQQLDLFLQKGDDIGFDNHIKNFFSTQELESLFSYPALKDKYIQIQRKNIGMNKEFASDELVLSLSNIKNKNITNELQNLISNLGNGQNFDAKFDVLSKFMNTKLDSLINNSKYLSDNYQIIDIVEKIIIEFGNDFEIGTQEYKKIEDLYNKMSHQIKGENQKKISDYINEKVSYLQSIGDLQAAELLQKIHKIDERQKVNVDDKNPSSFFGECKTQGDIYLTKLRLIEDEISRRGTQSPTKEAPKPTQSPEKAPNKIPEMQNSLSRLGLNVKIGENGSLIGINGETNFTQKIGNRTFEVKENGNIFIQGAFGYEFQYENNIDGIEQYLEIADQIEYVDHMGLGHFGTNLKDMIEILNLYTSYTGLKYINVDDSSLNSTNFINQVELTNISKAFYKIGFLSTENFSYGFKNGEMQKVEFTHIMQTNFEGRNFLKGGSFDREMFKNVITETNWKK